MPFDLNAYQRRRVYTDTPTIRLSHKQQKLVDFIVRDESGEPLDLTSLEFGLTEQALMSSASSSVVIANQMTVKLSGSYFVNSDGPLFTLNGTIVSATTGQVQFLFTPDVVIYPGLYVASVGVFLDNILRHQVMVYIEFMPTTLSLEPTGPLSVPEVRMELMDTSPDANYLLDELEFSDAEIIHAMRKAVDYFNEANPPVGGFSYDSFPFRAGWLKGTVGYLLQSAAHKFRRNSLRYSSGDLTIADQEKYQEYEQAGKRLQQEYEEWVEKKKVAINMNIGYASIAPSPYRRGRR